VDGKQWNRTYSGNALLGTLDVGHGAVEFFDFDVQFMDDDFQLLDLLDADQLEKESESK